MIELTLPWPPSVNTIWRRVGSLTLLSEKGRQYRQSVADQVLIQRVAGKLNDSDRLAVAIEAHAPDKRRRDLDNLPKAVLDALTHAKVWGDDSQIDKLLILRRANKKGGALVVTIQKLDAQ